MTIRTFALIIGIVYVMAGVAGFVPALHGPLPHDAPPVSVTAFYGAVLGLFPANFLHHLVHLAIGAWGIAASRKAAGARAFAKVLAVFYAVLGVMGLIPALNTVFGLIPLFGLDVWLHFGTAAIAAFFGWVVKGSEAMHPRTTVHGP